MTAMCHGGLKSETYWALGFRDGDGQWGFARWGSPDGGYRVERLDEADLFDTREELVRFMEIDTATKRFVEEHPGTRPVKITRTWEVSE